MDAVTALNDRREHASVAACSRRGKWNSDKLSRFEDDRRRRQKAPHRLRPSRSSSGRLRCAVSAAFILFDTESCVFAFFRACQCHAASRAARDLTLSPPAQHLACERVYPVCETGEQLSRTFNVHGCSPLSLLAAPRPPDRNHSGRSRPALSSAGRCARAAAARLRLCGR